MTMEDIDLFEKREAAETAERERKLRIEAERLREEEQKRREESEKRREEEQKRREDEQKRREDEQKRREEAEKEVARLRDFWTKEKITARSLPESYRIVARGFREGSGKPGAPEIFCRHRAGCVIQNKSRSITFVTSFNKYP